MTESIQHSFHVQQDDEASQLATRRYRSQRKVPVDLNVMGLPPNEWGFLLSGVQHCHKKLVEQLQQHQGLDEEGTQWIQDRLVETTMLIDLIKVPDFRRGFFDWCQGVIEELELIDDKQTPKLL